MEHGPSAVRSTSSPCPSCRSRARQSADRPVFGSRAVTSRRRASYSACVGLPGDGKSPAVGAVVKPMRQIDEVNFAEWKEEKAEFDAIEAVNKRHRPKAPSCDDQETKSSNSTLSAFRARTVQWSWPGPFRRS